MKRREEVESVAASLQEKLTIDDDEGPKELLQKLRSLHCPFTWIIPNDPANVKRALELAESKQKFHMAISSPLIRCFESAKRGQLDQAFIALQEWKLNKRSDVLLNVGNDLEKKENVEGFQSDAHRVHYHHVFYSCECFMFFKLKRFEECEETLAKIVPFQELSPEVQGEVYWLKADYVKEYGYAGQKQAIDIIISALKFYPQCLSLKRLLGILLGRVRRIEGKNDFRDIKVLEDVLLESYDPRTAVLLALTYREFIKTLKQPGKELPKVTQDLIENLTSKASDIYSRCFSELRDDAYLASRVAEGFIRLPAPWRDLDKAWQCLEIALAAFPSDPHLHHITGTYYTLRGDLAGAKSFLQRSTRDMTTNYGACMDLILVYQQADPNYNPMGHLESLLVHITEESHVEDILCNLGIYAYVEMRDFEKAFMYWTQVIQRNIQSKKLKTFHCRLLKTVSNVSIVKVMTFELNKRVNMNECPEEGQAVLCKLIGAFPELKSSFAQMNIAESVSPDAKLTDSNESTSK